jgi:hypothetical protein
MITLAISFIVGLTFGMFFGCALGVNSEKDKRIKDLENRLKEPYNCLTTINEISELNKKS